MHEAEALVQPKLDALQRLIAALRADVEELREHLHTHGHPVPPKRRGELVIVFSTATDQPTLTGAPMPPAATPASTFTDAQQVIASLSEADAKGNPTGTVPTFDAPPAWTTSNSAVAAVTPSADGTTCTIVGGVPGTATISVAASVGGVAFAGVGDVTVTPGAAASIALVFGAPTAQPGS